MDPFALLLFAAFGVAGWIITQRAKTARAENEVAHHRRQFDAIQWARVQPDLDAAEEQLSEQLTDEDNREAQAWDRFKNRWKPSLWDHFRLKTADGTIHSLSAQDFARRDFLATFQSRKPELLAKARAISEERNHRHQAELAAHPSRVAICQQP